MTDFIQRLNPDGRSHLEWQTDKRQEIIPDAIRVVKRRFNEFPYGVLTTNLRDQVRHDPDNGIAYAVLGNHGDSRESAVMHINPYGNGLTDNMLLRAEFVRESLNAVGIRDQNGDSLPVIALGAPGMGRSALKMERRVAYRKTAEGFLGHVAAEYLKVAREQNFGRVAIVGFSLGASLAPSAAVMAEGEGLDVTRIVAGDPANVVKRKPSELFKDFNSEAKYLEKDYTEPRIEHFITAHKEHESELDYAAGILRRAKINLALFKGLTEDRFKDDLFSATYRGVPSTVAYGTSSLVSPSEHTHAAIEKSRQGIYGGDHLVHSVSVEHAHHTWGDRVDLLSTLYAYGLGRLVPDARSV